MKDGGAQKFTDAIFIKTLKKSSRKLELFRSSDIELHVRYVLVSVI